MSKPGLFVKNADTFILMVPGTF